MIKWIRTSRLSIKNSLSLQCAGGIMKDFKKNAEFPGFLTPQPKTLNPELDTLNPKT